jgi:phosphopantothenoylcysteine decarboxylase / phosphopantothenate---cysteine ligase
MARILLGVSGGIAAYKAVELVRLATKAGHSVRVVQTPAAQQFVGAATFEGITGAPVLSGEFERDPARGAYPGEPAPDHDPISHLELVRRCDAYVIAPASANTIAKLAAGLADNLLTSAALASTAPLVVAPAMNNAMYEHAATRANLEKLRARGVVVVDPGTGPLASKGEWGVGRLAAPAEILAAVEAVLEPREDYAPRSLDGLRVLVTAGGTREPIDSVRYVGNRSSGRMGFAVADEATARGADVTVIAANVSLPRTDGVRYQDVETAAELEEAARRLFPEIDVLVMAAAVADFRPPAAESTKLSKAGRDALELRLEPTTDVLAALSAERRPGQTLVGFAAEHGPEGVDRARGKLERKGLDAVVVNDISRDDIGFDSDENEVTIVTEAGDRALAKAPKDEIACAIV